MRISQRFLAGILDVRAPVLADFYLDVEVKWEVEAGSQGCEQISVLAHFAWIPSGDKESHIYVSLQRYLNTERSSWQPLARASKLAPEGRFQVYINIRILTRETVCVIILPVIVESLAKSGTWAGSGQVAGECLLCLL